MTPKPETEQLVDQSHCYTAEEWCPYEKHESSTYYLLIAIYASHEWCGCQDPRSKIQHPVIPHHDTSNSSHTAYATLRTPLVAYGRLPSILSITCPIEEGFDLSYL